jgi:fibronectin type 3 domain-containing protein
LDQDNKVIIPKITPVDSTARVFIDQIETARNSSAKDQELFNGLMAFNVFGNFEQAKALGLAAILPDVRAGKKNYNIQGLTAQGKPGTPVLISSPVDSSVATDLPPAPENLKAVPALSGAQLFWSPVKDNPKIPVLSYGVERITPGPVSLSASLLKGISWNPELPAYTDTTVPVEQELTYHVYSIDAFGRKSLPAKISFFMPDLVAMLPPTDLKADATTRGVTLEWQHDSPNTAGFMVERSSQRDGLYDVLTPEGLKPTVRTYQDKTVIQGLSYYYRLRAMGPGGMQGEPTMPVTVKVLSDGPPQPLGLTAEVSPILVVLSWEKSEFPVAGFFVERRAKASKEWARLHSGIVFNRSFKDRFPIDSFGAFVYRVTAVDHSHRQSKPSRELEVIRPDLNPPPVPAITSISGDNGEVTLIFEPGHPKEKTVSCNIIRDLPDRKEGKTIATNVPVKKTRFVDNNVIPGQGYWYAVVAIDSQGKESPWSDKHLVMVTPPQVPQPEKPKVRFIDNPFAHVRIEFKKPPQPFTVSVQRQKDGEDYWQTLLKDITGTDSAIDAHPVRSGISRYRVVYQSSSGGLGEPSEPVVIEP